MKVYQPCEVVICLWDSDDVVRTSETKLVEDRFTDENWWKGGIVG